MTLRTKTFLPLALLSGLFFLFLYGYWFPQSLRNLEQQELRATAQHLNSIAEGLVPLLLAHQLDSVHENLDAQLGLNKEWVSIRLTDPGGRLLYPLQETPAAQNRDFRMMEQRMQFLGNDLGNLSLTINIASTTAAAETRYRQLATALLIVFCGYLISITVIVERIVRRPVNRLAHAAEKMAQGDFDATLVKNGNDEVGTLVNSFAVMRDALREYQANLQESEQKVRRKLEAILTPEADISTLELADMIDSKNIQKLMDDFYRLTRIGVGIIDLNGKVLVGTGWQDICTRFHRVNPESCRLCIESDLELSRNVPVGTFKLYRCKNNMWDMATPIMLGDQQMGNIFLGQFFFDDDLPDYETFRIQARHYGFNEEEYLAALDRVPRWSRETLDAAMSFYTTFAVLISNLSYSTIKLARALEERKRTEESLRKTARDLNEAQRIAHLGSWDLDLLTNQLSWSDEIYRIFEIDPGTFGASYEAFLQAIHPDDREAVNAVYLNAVKSRMPYSIDHRLLLPDRRVKYVHEQCETFYESDKPVRSAGTVQDITGQKLVEERLRTISEELEERVRERTAELAAKNAELEKMNKVFVGRELKMVELKERIRELETKP